MAIISQKTWDNIPKEEKEKLYSLINENPLDEFDEGFNFAIEQIFDKKHLQPKPNIRTWEDIINIYPAKVTGIIGLQYEVIDVVGIEDKIAQKIVATAKIAKLIELGYGGMVSEEEWKNNDIPKYGIYFNVDDWKLKIGNFSDCGISDFIAFHTKQQAKEFISYSENVELVKQYNMV